MRRSSAATAQSAMGASPEDIEIVDLSSPRGEEERQAVSLISEQAGGSGEDGVSDMFAARTVDSTTANDEGWLAYFGLKTATHLVADSKGDAYDNGWRAARVAVNGLGEMTVTDCRRGTSSFQADSSAESCTIQLNHNSCVGEMFLVSDASPCRVLQEAPQSEGDQEKLGAASGDCWTYTVSEGTEQRRVEFRAAFGHPSREVLEALHRKMTEVVRARKNVLYNLKINCKR